MSIFSSSNWQSAEARLIRFADGGMSARGPESSDRGRWPESSDGRGVDPAMALYQSKNAYGEQEVDLPRYNKGRQLTESEGKTQKFISAIEKANARRNELMQRLAVRRDATFKEVRKGYADLAKELETAYEAKMQDIREKEWKRYTLVLGLEDVLDAFEKKVTDREEYLKTTGRKNLADTEEARRQYKASRETIFGAEVSRDLTAKVTEAEQALKEAKEEAARAGLGTLEDTEKDARDAWDEVDTKRVAANAEVQALQKKVTEAEKAGTDLPAEQTKLDDLRKDKTDTEKSVSDKKEELKTKLREADDYGIHPLTHNSEAALILWAKNDIAKLPDTPDKETKKQQIIEVRDKWIKKAEDIVKLDEEIKKLEKHVQDLGDDTKGLIKDGINAVNGLKKRAEELPKLKKDLEDKKKEEVKLVEETKEKKGVLDEATAKADKVRKPMVDAQAALDAAKLNRANARKLVAPRAPSEKQKMEFVAQADATLTAINEEGFHLRNQFEVRSSRMNARLVILVQQRTNILEDLARERGLNADRETVGNLLETIRGEKRYLLRYGKDYEKEEDFVKQTEKKVENVDVRLTHLNDLESDWSKQMGKILAKETDDAVNPAKPGSPEEQEWVIRQELAFYAKYPPDDAAGKGRLAALDSKNPAVKGRLQEAWDKAHKPLHDATEAAVASARTNATVPLIHDAIAKVRGEGQYLWVRGYNQPRIAVLQTALNELQGLLAKSRVRDATKETETASDFSKPDKPGRHSDRMARVEKMQAELGTRAETGLDPTRMDQLKKDINTEEATILMQVQQQGSDVLTSNNIGAIETVIDSTVQARRFFRAGRTPESKGREETMDAQLLALRRSLATVTDEACKNAKERGAQPDQVKTAVDTATQEFKILLKYPEFAGYADGRIGQLRSAMSGILLNVDTEIFNLMDTSTLKPKFVTTAAQGERLLLLIDKDLAARVTLSAVWKDARNAEWEAKLSGLQANLNAMKAKGWAGLVDSAEAEKTRTVETTLAAVDDYVREFDRQWGRMAINKPEWIKGLDQVLTGTLVALEGQAKPAQLPLVAARRETVRQKLWNLRGWDERAAALSTEKPVLLSALDTASQAIRNQADARNGAALNDAIKAGERVAQDHQGTIARVQGTRWPDADEVVLSFQALEKQIVEGKRVMDTISPV